jgi:hypothetical protein
MIWELAEFESKTELVRTREADISHDGFGNDPGFRGKARRPALRFSSIITQPGLEQVCTWRTCLSAASSAEEESARLSFLRSLAWPRKRLAPFFALVLD